MTDEKEFQTYLTALAAMTPNFVLTKELIAVFDEAASKIGYGKASRAVKQFIAENSSRDPFPSVSDMLKKSEFNSLDAEEIAAKIFGAVSKFGSYRVSDARIFLGEVAWKIVTMEGGWESLCQMITYENASTLQAQWRKLASVVIQRKNTEKLTEIGYLKKLTGFIEKL